jgi:hypothetical protein
MGIVLLHSQGDIPEVNLAIDVMSYKKRWHQKPVGNKLICSNNQSTKYNVLVATDAVGIELNLNIWRVIFNSLSKYNGDKILHVPSYVTHFQQWKPFYALNKWYHCGYVKITETLHDSSIPPW